MEVVECTVKKHLAAIELTGYDPTKDPDGSGAKLLIELIVGVLEKRLEALKDAVESAVPAVTAPVSVVEQSEPSSDEKGAEKPESRVGPSEEVPAPAVVPGEAWSSGPDEESKPSAATEAADSDDDATESSEDADQSHS